MIQSYKIIPNKKLMVASIIFFILGFATITINIPVNGMSAEFVNTLPGSFPLSLACFLAGIVKGKIQIIENESN